MKKITSKRSNTLTTSSLVFALILGSGVFVACGGGGGSSTPSTDNNGDSNNGKNNGGSAIVSARNALQLDALDNQIRPAYADAYQAAQTLTTRTNAFCDDTTASPSEKAAKLTELKSSWKNVSTAWAAAEVYDASKLSTTGVRNALYINSFPDSKSLIPNRIDKLLVGSDTLNAAWAKDSPATNVGITSIEYTLYGTDEKPVKLADFAGRRCDLLKAQAGQLESDLKGYDALWKGSYGNDFKNNTDFFSTEGAALSAWYNSVLTLVEFMKDRKLGDPASFSTGAVKGHYEARYADISKVIYAKNFDTASRALVGNSANNGLVAYLRVLGATSLADKVTSQVQAVNVALSAISEDSLADTTAEKRKALYDAMSALTTTVKNDVSAAAKIQVTFNGNDGD